MKLSVVVVTYNHESFIGELLVTQECNFEYKIVVADDAPTDKTRDVISRFAAEHTCINPIYREYNVGALRNSLYALNQSSGDYICRIDGDDCSNPGKLQRVANYQDSHPDVAFVAHPSQAIDADGNEHRVIYVDVRRK